MLVRSFVFSPRPLVAFACGDSGGGDASGEGGSDAAGGMYLFDLNTGQQLAEDEVERPEPAVEVGLRREQVDDPHERERRERAQRDLSGGEVHAWIMEGSGRRPARAVETWR